MCFSAAASFTASAILFPLGLYSVIKAFRKDKRYLSLAFIPIVFSIHQFVEGLIWDKLHANAYTSLHHSVLAFTFIAFFIWPVYLPLSIYFIEPASQRRTIIGGLTLCGLVLGLAIYTPLFIGIASIDVSVVHHSISYPIYQPLSMEKINTIFYVLIIFLSLFLCSIKEIKIFGLLLLSSLLVTVIYFYYALSSVWCFFAALLSLYIVYCMRHLPLSSQLKIPQQ